MARPFRFGLSVWSAASRTEWRAKVREVEELGFDVLSVPDHLADGMFPPLLALAVAAEATDQLRLSPLVLNNDLRHPALVAREAAALDLLSDGRVELGLGAGHMQSELASIGVAYDAPPVRVARLAESVEVIARLLDGETLSFSGEHYQLNECRNFPRPLQQPMPLLIGGNGRGVLELAARRAAIVGFTGFFPSSANRPASAPHFTSSGFARRLAIVRQAAGERFDALELHALLQAVIVTDDARAAAERLRAHMPGLSVDDLLDSPFLLIGSVDAMADALLERRERFGLSYFTAFEAGKTGLANVAERLRGR